MNTILNQPIGNFCIPKEIKLLKNLQKFDPRLLIASPLLVPCNAIKFIVFSEIQKGIINRFSLVFVYLIKF